MLDIYLCRHGQSVANADGILAGHLDSPLNNIGRKQAQELSDLAKSANLRFDHIYCSPLSRARDTAKIIAKNIGSPEPIVMDELIERDFGILTGKRYTDIPKYATEVLGTEKIGYFLGGEGVESFPDALDRAQYVLDKIHATYNSGSILLVTHGDLGLMLFSAFHHTPWKQALTDVHFGNSELLLLHEDAEHKPHVFEIDQRGVKEKD